MMDDFSPLSSALSSPNASPSAKRKKSLRDAVAAVRKSSLNSNIATPHSTTPVESPSINSRKSIDEEKRVKNIIQQIVHTSPQYRKRDFSFSTNRDFKPPSSSSGVGKKLLQNQRAVDFLLLTNADSNVVKRFEKSDRCQKTIQAARLDPLDASLSAFASKDISRVNSRAGTRPNSRGVLVSRGRSRGGSRGSRSRPGTVNEVFEGDVFQSIDEIGETDVKISLVKVIKVDSSTRIAQSENKQTYFCHELLNPRKYRRVINNKPKTSNTSSEVGSAVVWFEDPISSHLFSSEGEVPEMSQMKANMLPSQIAIIASNKYEAREGFLETSRRYRHDDDRLHTDARRAFIHACREKNLNPLPIVIRKLQNLVPILDLSNQMLGSKYVDCLSVVFKGTPFLQSLDVSCNKFDGRAGEKIINELFHSNVHSLVLDRNKWGKNIAKTILELLLKQTKESQDRLSSFPECLRILSMNDTSLGDLGGGQLCNSLHKLVNITTLLIRENQLSDYFVNNISSFLKALYCPLLHLDLSWNNLRTEGAIELMKAISCKSSQLEILKLDWNGVNDEFLSFLEKFLRSSPNVALKKLSICNNMLSTQRLGSMINLRPALEIAYSEVVFTSDLVIGR